MDKHNFNTPISTKRLLNLLYLKQLN